MSVWLAAAAALATVGGPHVGVSPTEGLPAKGATVRVTGAGFDVAKGIYVAFCVDRGPGVRPTPCGGGADTTGTGSGSKWISSDPPQYGRDLATPYGPGGSFTVELSVSARIGEFDCRKVRCAVVTRADHTRPEDRSQDSRVPVTFAASQGVGAASVAVAGVGAVAAGAAGAVVFARRRKAVPA